MIFWSAVTLGLEVLGSVGAIGTFPILAWAGLIAGAGVVLWWMRRPRSSPSGPGGR